MRQFRFILTLVFLWPADFLQADVAKTYNAVCRIHAPDGSAGTGCVFEISQGLAFILTNRHVVDNNQTVKCVFWHDGHQSSPLPATVRARASEADVALVAVPTASFAGILPEVIPMAPRGTQLQPGETITSVGCAEAAWATGWKGHVLGYDGPNLCFLPPPAGGRSGSALFDAEGRSIVGLIWGRQEGPQTRGYAVSLENIYRAFQFTRTNTGWRHTPEPLEVIDAQCGPGGCPTPGQILPYRQYDQYQGQQRDRRLDRLEDQADRAWPTLPGTPPAPPGAPLLGSGTSLDQIEQHLKRQDDQMVAIARAVDAKIYDLERSQEGAVEKLGKLVAGSAGGAVFGWAKTIFSTLGLGGGIGAVVLLFFAVRQGRKNAHLLAAGVDKVTDWIPGQWDDRILDPLAMKVADLVGTDTKKTAAAAKSAAVKAAKAAAVKAAKEEIVNGKKK